MVFRIWARLLGFIHAGLDYSCCSPSPSFSPNPTHSSRLSASPTFSMKPFWNTSAYMSLYFPEFRSCDDSTLECGCFWKLFSPPSLKPLSFWAVDMMGPYNCWPFRSPSYTRSSLSKTTIHSSSVLPDLHPFCLLLVTSPQFFFGGARGGHVTQVLVNKLIYLPSHLSCAESISFRPVQQESLWDLYGAI